MGGPIYVDEKLKEWATDTQKKSIDAYLKYKSLRKAAVHLGIDSAAVHKHLTLAKKKAVTYGWAPEYNWKHPVPDLHIVKGVSQYFNKEGEPAGVWVKTRIDEQKLRAAVLAAVEALSEDVPKAKPVRAPKVSESGEALCNLYTFTDCHVGMLSWGEETGDDWDLKIAEETLVQAFDFLVLNAPKAKACVINQLGDFLHFDGLEAVTPTSGHVLDADGRFSKVIKIAVRILRHIINTALKCHKTVYVVIAEGNHDIASSVWLRHLFALLYEDELRVQIVESEAPYYAVVHGSSLLGFHHGHLAKKESLPGFFSAFYREAWGKAKFCYIHTGHWHHTEEKEYPGVFVVQHPTLSARDAYAARNALLSVRRITAITYHAEYGEVGRTTFSPDMLEKQPKKLTRARSLLVTNT